MFRQSRERDNECNIDTFESCSQSFLVCVTLAVGWHPLWHSRDRIAVLMIKFTHRLFSVTNNTKTQNIFQIIKCWQIIVPFFVLPEAWKSIYDLSEGLFLHKYIIGGAAMFFSIKFTDRTLPHTKKSVESGPNIR